MGTIATFEDLWGSTPIQARIHEPWPPGQPFPEHLAGALDEVNLFRLPGPATAQRDYLLDRVKELQRLAGVAESTTWEQARAWVESTQARVIAEIEDDTVEDDESFDRRERCPPGYFQHDVDPEHPPGHGVRTVVVTKVRKDPANPGQRIEVQVLQQRDSLALIPDNLFPHSPTHQALCNVFPRRFFVEAAPDTVTGSAEMLYGRLQAMVTGRGFPWDESRVHVVALRAYQDGQVNGNWGLGERQGRYNDTYFVAWRKDGVAHVWEALGTTDPGDSTEGGMGIYTLGANQQLCYRFNVNDRSKGGRWTHAPLPGAPGTRTEAERRDCLDLDWPGVDLPAPARGRLPEARKRLKDRLAPAPAPGAPTPETAEVGDGKNDDKHASFPPFSHLTPERQQALLPVRYSTYRYHGRDGSVGTRRRYNAMHSSLSPRNTSDDPVNADSAGCLVIHKHWYARFCMEIKRGLTALPDRGNEFVVTLLDARDLLARIRRASQPLSFNDEDDEQLELQLEGLSDDWLDELTERIVEADRELSSSVEKMGECAALLNALRDQLDDVQSKIEVVEGYVEKVDELKGRVELAQNLLEMKNAIADFDAMMDPRAEDYHSGSITEKAAAFTRVANTARALFNELPVPDRLKEFIGLLAQSGTALLEAGAAIFEKYHTRLTQPMLRHGGGVWSQGLNPQQLPPAHIDYYFRKLGGSILLGHDGGAGTVRDLKDDARNVGSYFMERFQERGRPIDRYPEGADTSAAVRRWWYTGSLVTRRFLPSGQRGSETYEQAMVRTWTNIYLFFGCAEDTRWANLNPITGLRATRRDGLLATLISERAGGGALHTTLMWANPMRIFLRAMLHLTDHELQRAFVELGPSRPAALSDYSEAQLAQGFSAVPPAAGILRGLFAVALRGHMSAQYCSPNLLGLPSA